MRNKPMHTLAFINESTRLSKTQVAAIAEACTKQFAHACPLWHKPTVVCFVANHLRDIPQFTPRVVFLDHADQANALGYHDLGPDGIPYAKVFVGLILDSGGHVFDDEEHNGNTVSVCASHEALEILGDPSANDWRIGPQLEQGAGYALELCDPVQAYSYTVRTDLGPVAVSDFVLPKYFGAHGPAGKFDYLNLLHKPFSVGPGGYLIIRNSKGEVSEVFGKSRFPAHPASRKSRREENF